MKRRASSCGSDCGNSGCGNSFGMAWQLAAHKTSQNQDSAGAMPMQSDCMGASSCGSGCGDRGCGMAAGCAQHQDSAEAVSERLAGGVAGTAESLLDF